MRVTCNECEACGGDIPYRDGRSMKRTVCSDACLYRRRYAKWPGYQKKPRPEREDYFFAKVSMPDDLDDCWEWTGSTGEFGHGLFWNGARQMNAHRWSWEWHFGSIPEGLFVRHRCDNPPCVNPWHLILGNHLENMHDARLRNRTARGERAGAAKLTDAQVAEIRRRFIRTSPRRSNSKELAIEFGVHAKHICRVADGKERARA